MTSPAAIHLTFTPGVASINSTREYVSVLYDEALGDRDLASRLALTVHELLENVVKYSKDGVANIDIELLQREAGSFAQVRIRSRAEGDGAAQVRCRVDELQAASDPLALYYEMMLAARPESGESGLGAGSHPCRGAHDTGV
jgi:hypothetical protein